MHISREFCALLQPQEKGASFCLSISDSFCKTWFCQCQKVSALLFKAFNMFFFNTVCIRSIILKYLKVQYALCSPFILIRKHSNYGLASLRCHPNSCYGFICCSVVTLWHSSWQSLQGWLDLGFRFSLGEVCRFCFRPKTWTSTCHLGRNM